MGVNGPAVSTTCSPWNVEHTIGVRLSWDTRTGDVECGGGREMIVDGTGDAARSVGMLEP